MKITYAVVLAQLAGYTRAFAAGNRVIGDVTRSIDVDSGEVGCQGVRYDCLGVGGGVHCDIAVKRPALCGGQNDSKNTAVKTARAAARVHNMILERM